MNPETRFRALVWIAGCGVDAARWARRNWPALLTLGAVLALIAIIVSVVLDGESLPGIWLGGMCISRYCGSR